MVEAALAATKEHWASQLLPLVQQGVVASESQDAILRALDARLEDLEHFVDVARGEAVPKFVKCSGGQIHCVASPEFTLCGWHWPTKQWEHCRMPPASATAFGWCRSCTKKYFKETVGE